MLREDYLQQNAFSDVDARSGLKKQYLMLKSIMKFHERTKGVLDLGVQLKKIANLPSTVKIGRMKETPETNIQEFDKLHKEIDDEFEELVKSR
jgi:V/A-type H+-transporting ATPase subunit A